MLLWISSRTTNFLKQSPWEAYSFLASQKTPQILRNQNVYYRVHRSPQLVPVESHRNPACDIPSYLFIILQKLPQKFM
jgi:hypothetical protein